MDYSAISSAVVFTDVYTGMGVVYAAIAGLLIARRGAGILLGAITGR